MDLSVRDRVADVLRKEFAAWQADHPNAGLFDWRVAAENVLRAAKPQRGAVSDADFDKLLVSIDNLRGYRCAEQTAFLMHVEAVYVDACALAERLQGAVEPGRLLLGRIEEAAADGRLPAVLNFGPLPKHPLTDVSEAMEAVRQQLRGAVSYAEHYSDQEDARHRGAER